MTPQNPDTDKPHPYSTVALPDGIVIGGPWPDTIITWPGIGYDGKGESPRFRKATKPEYDLFQALETATAEISQLKAAIELGQINCDAVYEDLRKERDAARAACLRAHEFFAARVNAKEDVALELRSLAIGAGISAEGTK